MHPFDNTSPQIGPQYPLAVSDRVLSPLEQVDPVYPLAPLNFAAQSGLEKGIIDLRWDLPTNLFNNSKYSIIGVNIYRSFDSEFGPFFRLNDVPIGTTYWRDMNRVTLALEEDVSRSFLTVGTTDPERQWTFKTQQAPIVIHPWLGAADCTSLNVSVTINGVQAYVKKIIAEAGEVTLQDIPQFDVASQQMFPPVLPTSPNDVVLATYRYLSNHVKTDLGQRIFYRITSVAHDPITNDLIETPLDRATTGNNQQTEQLDWIWREAIRRNRFLLTQGGERVKLFIRKLVGQHCGCNSNLYGQPDASCETCYGTGIIGGYDGAYDILVAPDDAEKAITQGNRGRTMTHAFDSWTGPVPLLSQRDFVVKLNGDRYAIGPVRMPTVRGMSLQQFFSLSHLDEQDIRYKVPVLNTQVLVSPQTRYIIPGQGGATPMITDRHGIPAERQIRGSTPTFENSNSK
jgi:hypothetical protein